MRNYINSFRNLGVTPNLNKAEAQRVRLANSMSIVGILAGISVTSISYFANWPNIFVFIFCTAIFSLLISPTLNFFNKTITSRVCFLVNVYAVVTVFLFLWGSSLHFQYYLFSFLGLPLLVFANEIGQKKFLLSILGILLFIYLEIHFYFWEPLVTTGLPYQNTIRILNDVLVGLIILAQLYLFVDENDKYVDEIQTKSKELEDKNIQLEHFAYIASHDLKEPMRTVNSLVSIIKDEYGDKTDDNLNTYFGFIDKALVRMKDMVNGLLDYSRIGESGSFEKLNLNNLITEISEDLGLLIQEKDVSLQYNNLPTIYCFKQETKQLFQNLITNAIKFQQQNVKPVIKISWSELPDYWEFCFADNGIGIPENKQKEIFQFFTKLHRATEFEGHGIGLAFCKKIVESHKGKIWVESELGEGSQFYFTIKKAID